MFYRALAALLLSVPAGAQSIRMRGGLLPLSTPAPVIAGPGSPAAVSAAVPLFPIAPSLAPSLPALAARPVPLSAAAATDVPKPGRPAAVLARPATPADGWAARFDFQPGREFFDGERALKSEAGAVFAAVPKPGGAARVHLVERAPPAALRPVGGTDGLSGRALLEKVASIAAQGQRQHEYSESSDYLFSKAESVVIDGVRGVVDAYSGIFVPGTSKDGGDYPERGDQNGDGYEDRAGMNVEHTWPQSLFKQALPMRSDLHHLMTTFDHPNSIRGNLPFGEVTEKPDYENKAGAKRGGGVFEPPDAVKGRVARGLLYFYSRYKNSRTFGRASADFWNRQIELLLRWNREHPPDAFEARRNDLVESYQGNRNPFIDDPSLAERIGAEALRADPPTRVRMTRGRGRLRPTPGRLSRRR